MKEEIVHNLCQLRHDRDVTQESLAEALGVTRQTIIAIEKGRYTPSLCLALKIADYFALPVESIFSFKEV